VKLVDTINTNKSIIAIS